MICFGSSLTTLSVSVVLFDAMLWCNAMCVCVCVYMVEYPYTMHPKLYLTFVQPNKKLCL